MRRTVVKSSEGSLFNIAQKGLLMQDDVKKRTVDFLVASCMRALVSAFSGRAQILPQPESHFEERLGAIGGCALVAAQLPRLDL